MRKATSIGLILFLVMSSCKKQLDTASYMSYIQNPENGLRKKVALGQMTYTFQYKPSAYIGIQEQLGGKVFDERLKGLKGTVWFNISFVAGDGSSSPLRFKATAEEYEARYNYFLTMASKDIKVLYGEKDTLQQLAYLFENNYNLTPHETMVIGYRLPEGVDSPEKEIQISYYDQVFKNGIVKVKYSASTLKNIPELKR